MTKLPRYTDDPQELSLSEAVHDNLWSMDDAELVQFLDRYVGRDVWLRLLEDRHLDDIMVAIEEEYAGRQAEAAADSEYVE
jgi:hypothetical protein